MTFTTLTCRTKIWPHSEAAFFCKQSNLFAGNRQKVSAVDTLQTIVVGLGGALCVWGGVNLLEGYGADNPASKSQGIKQLVAGGGVALIGMTLVPLLSGLLG